MVIENEQELGKAIDNGEETIKVKGRLAPGIKKIWYMDQILWCLCLACLTAAIAALVMAPTTGGISTALTAIAGTPAALVLGSSASSMAVLTALAGSGIMTLKRLKNGYKLESISNDYVVLHRK